MKTKHTPGPWAIWTSNSYRRIGSESTGKEVAYPTTQASDGHPDIVFPNGGEDGPDARLIAAAPGLLNDLAEANREIERLREHNRMLQATIDAQDKKCEELTSTNRRLREKVGRDSLPCSMCGLPVMFEFTVESVIWNRIVRRRGIGEYLCAWCFNQLAEEDGETRIQIGVNFVESVVHSGWCNDDVPGTYPSEPTKAQLQAELAALRDNGEDNALLVRTLTAERDELRKELDEVAEDYQDLGRERMREVNQLIQDRDALKIALKNRRDHSEKCLLNDPIPEPCNCAFGRLEQERDALKEQVREQTYQMKQLHSELLELLNETEENTQTAKAFGEQVDQLRNESEALIKERDARINTLKARIQTLESALGHYADEANWGWYPISGTMASMVHGWKKPNGGEGPDIAREALRDEPKKAK